MSEASWVRSEKPAGRTAQKAKVLRGQECSIEGKIPGEYQPTRGGREARQKQDEEDRRRFREMFEEIGVSAYSIIDDETGFWIVLKKRAR